MKWGLTLVITCITITTMSGQSKKDSLIQVINSSIITNEKLPAYAELAFTIYLSNPDSGILLAQQGFSLAEIGKNRFQKASSLNALGLSYFRKGWYAKAISSFEQSIKLFDPKADQEQIARVYLNLGHVYQTQKDYRAANTYNIKALRCIWM